MSRPRRGELSTREMRVLLHVIKELRAALGEMLDFTEQAAMNSLWPHPLGGPARLCKILADSMRSEGGGAYRGDLRRIKRARWALGLPAWWDKP